MLNNIAKIISDLMEINEAIYNRTKTFDVPEKGVITRLQYLVFI